MRRIKKYYIFSICFWILFIFLNGYIEKTTSEYLVYEDIEYDCEAENYTYNNFSDAGDGMININSADIGTLMDGLEGIGEIKAQSIIDYREKTGGFYSVDEILNVDGIGIETFEKIKDYIYIDKNMS